MGSDAPSTKRDPSGTVSLGRSYRVGSSVYGSYLQRIHKRVALRPIPPTGIPKMEAVHRALEPGGAAKRTMEWEAGMP
jgi:hypothetical protein